MGFNQRNWVFATNSDILITTSLQPNVLDLRFFKFWILLDQIFKFCNIKDKLQLAYKDKEDQKIWVLANDSIPSVKDNSNYINDFNCSERNDTIEREVFR